jgi:glycerol-3-phosphate acyltransferase PlsY
MTPLTVFLLLAVVLTAYFIGSIPTGILLTRWFAGTDIRKSGSGNVGATNVRRVAGNALGAAVLLMDMLKGAVPVYLATHLHAIFSTALIWEICVSLAALSAFAGHLYPVYFKGRSGGKGVATAAGCFLMISPVSVAGAAVIFILMVWRSRMVSMGSLSAAAVVPAFVWLSSGSRVFSTLAVLVAVFIFHRHWDNIRRISEGTEPRI